MWLVQIYSIVSRELIPGETFSSNQHSSILFSVLLKLNNIKILNFSINYIKEINSSILMMSAKNTLGWVNEKFTADMWFFKFFTSMY